MIPDAVRRTTMPAVLLAVCASALPPAAGPSPAAVSGPSDPSGTWLIEDGDARIRIERCRRPRDRVCGYIVWTRTAEGRRDSRNPDSARRGREILGMQMLLGLSADGDAYSGPVYNAEDGKTYDARVRRDDPLHLTLKGCLMKYLCRSQTWTKVDDAATGQLTGPTDGRSGPRADPEWAQASAAPHGTGTKGAP